MVRIMTRDCEALIENIVPRDWKGKGLPVLLQTRVLECDELGKTKISVSNQGNPVFIGVESPPRNQGLAFFPEKPFLISANPLTESNASRATEPVPSKLSASGS